MGVTEHLTIAVPAELAERVRAHVASGAYDSENDILLEALRLWDADETNSEYDPEMESWLRHEVLPGLEAFDRNRSTGLTAEQVLASLAAARAERATRGLIAAPGHLHALSFETSRHDRAVHRRTEQ